MTSWSGFRLAIAAIGVGTLALLTAPAGAQAPPPYPPPPTAVAGPMPPPGPSGEASQAAHCLCERQQIASLAAQMDEKKRALEQIRQELADLDAQLQRARPGVDVNSPDAVERYKVLLERHDRAYQRSVGPITADAVAAVNRYNDSIRDYNSGCAHRLFDAPVMAAVRASLVCPPQ